MAIQILKRRGKKTKTITLLNPAEKREKFLTELSVGAKMTNDGEWKVNSDGEYQVLTDEEKAYRSGYLAAGKDSAKAYKHNQKKLGK